ncbi:hypothetical protein DM860_004040 [Cuscuta australis]|uniref:Uncharacterized protein n=1 Tax=Cuscuta australis TaxID=267555 RepID=A0A328CXI1_9ASTE|nr:hypothetical protein DM860_004040 [Cuscuta australis]
MAVGVNSNAGITHNERTLISFRFSQDPAAKLSDMAYLHPSSSSSDKAFTAKQWRQSIQALASFQIEAGVGL